MKELHLEIPDGKWIKNTVQADELKIYDTLIQIFCIFENVSLSFSERTLLCYYTKFGINKTTEKIFMEEFNRNRQIVANLKTHLANKKFIVKNPTLNIWELTPFLKLRKKDGVTLVLEFDVTE
jgi:ribosome-binding factor A